MQKEELLSKVKRKRGRPRKIRQVDEEQLEGNSQDDTFHQTGSCANTSSSGPASARPDPLTVSMRQTQYSKALADNEDAFGIPSRFPSQNDKMNLSENTCFVQCLIDAERFDQADGVPTEVFTSRSPVQTLEQHSQQENICPDNNLPEMVAAADENVQTHDLSTRSSGCDIPNIATENNAVISLSQLDNSFVVLNGYKVRKEIVPLLNAIFTKYGDIAKNSTFSMESRSCLLELVCSIYNRLEASKFMHLTSLELQSMLGQIGDLELVKVEVGWLHKRLLNISKARQLCDNVSTLKDVEARTGQEIDEKKQVVETYEKELESCMATVKKLQERLNQERDELSEATALFDEIKVFSEGSLVKGLV